MADLVRPVSVDTSMLVSTTAVAAEAAWLVGTTYSIGNLVNRDATVTLAGDIQVVQGRAWKSLANFNLGNDPATDDGTHWEDQGPTNPWLLFGDSATRQTTGADPLTVAVQMPSSERINTIWFGNLEGVSLRVTQTDPVDGVVFDTAFDLTSPSGITDPYHYSFDPIERLSELLVTGLAGGYSGSLITFEISDTPIVITTGGDLDLSKPGNINLDVIL